MAAVPTRVLPAQRHGSYSGTRIQGYLMKWTNLAFGYQRRYVVVTRGLLGYAYSEEDYHAGAGRGSMVMRGAVVTRDPTDSESFTVETYAAKYYLRASSPADRDRWLTALELASKDSTAVDGEAVDTLMILQTLNLRLYEVSDLKKNMDRVLQSTKSILRQEKVPIDAGMFDGIADSLRTQIHFLDGALESFINSVDTQQKQWRKDIMDEVKRIKEAGMSDAGTPVITPRTPRAALAPLRSQDILLARVDSLSRRGDDYDDDDDSFYDAGESIIASSAGVEEKPDVMETELQKEAKAAHAAIRGIRKSLTKPLPDGFDDTDLLRFLIARNFDIAKATAMLDSCIDWRQSFLPATITTEEVQSELGKGSIFLCGHDLEKRPILILDLGKNTPSNTDIVIFTRMVVLFMESVVDCMPHNVHQFTMILDFNTFSLNSADMNQTKGLFQVLSDYYPERLGCCLLVDAPWMFNAVWYALKGLMSPRTISKIHFINRGDIPKYIEGKEIPQRFGGRMDYEYSVDPKAPLGPATKYLTP
eukprot:Clim_evm18s231 gene=Clim_evmTU18s231